MDDFTANAILAVGVGITVALVIFCRRRASAEDDEYNEDNDAGGMSSDGGSKKARGKKAGSKMKKSLRKRGKGQQVPTEDLSESGSEL